MRGWGPSHPSSCSLQWLPSLRSWGEDHPCIVNLGLNPAAATQDLHILGQVCLSFFSIKMEITVFTL